MRNCSSNMRSSDAERGTKKRIKCERRKKTNFSVKFPKNEKPVLRGNAEDECEKRHTRNDCGTAIEHADFAAETEKLRGN